MKFIISLLLLVSFAFSFAAHDASIRNTESVTFVTQKETHEITTKWHFFTRQVYLKDSACTFDYARIRKYETVRLCDGIFARYSQDVRIGGKYYPKFEFSTRGKFRFEGYTVN